jgi:hypothetical protein
MSPRIAKHTSTIDRMAPSHSRSVEIVRIEYLLGLLEDKQQGQWNSAAYTNHNNEKEV